ncbi:MAG: hypothetical protein M1835_001590 [Candelina submexicana]|nr:MAG: hypothetical protein M1835_001590 [Candelina submexicana]
MGLINMRELLQFPSGENSTDVLINGIHFNRTALNYFNYTLWDNGTLSNGSKCFLTFDHYQPIMLSNGTFINGTSCYDPYYQIHSRGALGLTFACLFAASVMFTLINLRKHGRLFLPSEKRFTAIGRRWQWYWMLFVAACGIISGITGIDVDRDYLQSLALILQNFFYVLIQPGLLAAVWEATRHWGSWQERQICDRDPFMLPQDDKRGQKEFFMPLAFYLFAWLEFFMTIPRSWGHLEMQSSPYQQANIAKPQATDARFKAGSLLGLIAWGIICYALQHAVHYYKPRNRGLWDRFNGFFHYAPMKLMLAISVCFVHVGYNIACAFCWDISPRKYNANPGWIFGLGYGSAFLVLLIFEIYGYFEVNEDRQLIAQRIERGRTVDAELGIGKKPTWWSKMHRDNHLDAEQRLRNLTTVVGGGTATQKNIERDIEMRNLGPKAVQDPFKDQASDVRRRPQTPTDNGGNQSQRTMSTSREPQRIRSMLDI